MNHLEQNNSALLNSNELSMEDSGRFRELSGFSKNLVFTIGIIFAVFQLVSLIWKPIDPYYMRSIHLFFASIMIFALVPITKKSSFTRIAWIDILFILMCFWVVGYLLVEFNELIYRITTRPTTLDVLTSGILVILVLEITRRMQGWILPVFALIFLIYGLVGDYLPGLLWHRGYSVERLLGFIFSTNGIFGIPLGVSATYVFMFVLFGAFLQTSGVTRLFVDLSLALAGKKRGGPAKVAVITSALLGTVNGSSVGNVVTSGTFTIPLIKKCGYSPRFGGAVEAVASTGGQIMPPIMGAGAFLMADYLGIPYLAVTSAALIPAILYFLSVFLMVDLEAVKRGLMGLPTSQIPKLKTLLIKEAYLLLPIIILILALFILKVSPIRAAFYSMFSTIIVSWVKIDTRMGIKKILEALFLGSRGIMDIAATTAVAGIVIGVISLTGLGTRFSMIIMSYSGGNLLLGLILAMFVAIILGMGLPTVAAYAIAASIIAPGIIKLGADPIAAHLFILYFASLSAITPPVAIASFAAAAIAKANSLQVAATSVKLALAAYIIPYMFVYGPSLLMQGETITIITTLTTAIIGITAFAGSIQGWFIKRASLFLRLMLLTTGFLLIKPGISTDSTGILLLLIVLAFQYKERVLSLFKKEPSSKG